MTTWVRENSTGLVVGIVSSAIVSLGFWFLPALKPVVAAIGTTLQLNTTAQFVVVAVVCTIAGVATGVGAQLLQGRMNPAPAPGGPSEPSSKGVPTFPSNVGGQESIPAPSPQGATPPTPDAEADSTVPSGPATTPQTWPSFSREELIANARILLIDDGQPDKIAMFKRRGFHIDIENTVEHDSTNRYELRYDLILLDQRGIRDDFGAKRGSDALPLLRKDNPWIPIVLFTSYPNDLRGETLDEVKAHSDVILRKSTRYDRMETKIMALLRSRRSREYFEGRLRQLGVDDPSATTQQILEGDKADLEMLHPPASDTARRLVEVAERIVNAARGER